MQDVKVLAVNERFLERFKQRYLRIATEIFFNISKILSDRLEHAHKDLNERSGTILDKS